MLNRTGRCCSGGKRNRMHYDVKTADEYLAGLPEDRATGLSALRRLICKTLPAVTESIQYGHMSFDLKTPLIALAAQKHFLALYVMETAAVAEFQGRVGTVSCGKSCVRFRKLSDLDLTGVEQLLRRAGELRQATG